VQPATGVRFAMLIQVHRKLGCVNSDVDGWMDQIHDHIEHGSNFLLILRRDPAPLKKFCNAFELEDNCHPRILTQGEFFLMSQHVEPAAFDAVLHHWDDNHQVVFAEQIDFLMNRPPRLKHFMVYSPVLGILAQHERLSGAKEMLEDYEAESALGAPSPEAGVYHWERGKWRLFEGR
jgi:hypothetical protein